MKYEILLSKTESKTVQIECETRDIALRRARSEHPGFTADDAVIGLDADDEVVESHQLIGQCESCEAFIWEGQIYANDAEGIMVCAACMETFAAAERKPE